MTPPPPSSTLFPYTTLFRSLLQYLVPARLAPLRNRRGALGLARLGEALDPARTRTHLALGRDRGRSEEHTSELQSHSDLVCRLLLEKKKNHNNEREVIRFVI